MGSEATSREKKIKRGLKWLPWIQGGYVLLTSASPFLPWPANFITALGGAVGTVGAGLANTHRGAEKEQFVVDRRFQQELLKRADLLSIREMQPPAGTRIDSALLVPMVTGGNLQVVARSGSRPVPALVPISGAAGGVAFSKQETHFTKDIKALVEAGVLYYRDKPYDAVLSIPITKNEPGQPKKAVVSFNIYKPNGDGADAAWRTWLDTMNAGRVADIGKALTESCLADLLTTAITEIDASGT